MHLTVRQDPETVDSLISAAARMLARDMEPAGVRWFLVSCGLCEADVYLVYVAARLLAPYVS